MIMKVTILIFQQKIMIKILIMALYQSLQMMLRKSLYETFSNVNTS